MKLVPEIADGMVLLPSHKVKKEGKLWKRRTGERFEFSLYCSLLGEEKTPTLHFVAGRGAKMADVEFVELIPANIMPKVFVPLKTILEKDPSELLDIVEVVIAQHLASRGYIDIVTDEGQLGVYFRFSKPDRADFYTFRSRDDDFPAVLKIIKSRPAAKQMD